MNVSDLWPLSAKELGAISGDGFMYKSLARLERWLYKHSAICIGQSQEIVDYIASHGAHQTYLFRNGVNPERFKAIPKAESSDQLRIVYAGLLGYAQGILAVCEHIDFASLHAEFHIYGAGGEQEAIEQYIATHPKAGIRYRKEEEPVLKPSQNPNGSAAPLNLDSVIQRIFHKGLQKELQNVILPDFIRNINFVIHDIAVSGLLNLQIPFNMLFLLADRNPVGAGGQADSEEIA